MQLKVITTSITEKVTAAEIKGMNGYPDTDQDARIEKLITVARQWLENRTGLSCISKQYKAYFERSERDTGGFYELPVSPVLSSPAITVEVNGTDVTFQQKGLTKVKIRPDSVFGTLRAGQSSGDSYVEITFQAGEDNETANECIRRIVVSMFDDPSDAGVSFSRLPYDTLRLIEALDQNTGL